MQNKKVYFMKTMWDYLQYRLEPQSEVVEKKGISTILHLCRKGRKEGSY
jgi:hypothetical protein